MFKFEVCSELARRLLRMSDLLHSIGATDSGMEDVVANAMAVYEALLQERAKGNRILLDDLKSEMMKEVKLFRDDDGQGAQGTR